MGRDLLVLISIGIVFSCLTVVTISIRDTLIYFHEIDLESEQVFSVDEDKDTDEKWYAWRKKFYQRDADEQSLAIRHLLTEAKDDDIVWRVISLARHIKRLDDLTVGKIASTAMERKSTTVAVEAIVFFQITNWHIPIELMRDLTKRDSYNVAERVLQELIDTANGDNISDYSQMIAEVVGKGEVINDRFLKQFNALQSFYVEDVECAKRQLKELREAARKRGVNLREDIDTWHYFHVRSRNRLLR
jgi:hypothetical protein